MYRPSWDHAGQWICIPPRTGTTSLGLPPSALATNSESPADDPARTNRISVPSGDQRSARPSATTLRGGPPSGAGTTQASNCAAGVAGVAPASKAIDDPSGEMERPPRSERLWILSVVDAVRLIGSPPPRNRAHTSVEPRAFDRYAIHFPSGEMAGANSEASPCVICVTRENQVAPPASVT